MAFGCCAVLEYSAAINAATQSAGFAAVAAISRDCRGHLMLELKGRGETLQGSDSYSQRFKQM